ncbi:MAG: hypothetical protein KF824_02420 [Fimbriimonadaceae bacterium]|nr:MAG: hypothetical protein KF824_02420 [Fimbriimonadaceae bacterium]
MNAVRWSMLIYGLCLIAMGVQAYFFPMPGSKVSPISLIAAGTLGVTALGFTYLSVKARSPRGAYIGTVILCLIVIGQFMGKVVKGEASFYPHILTIILSVAMIVILGMGHMMAMKRKEAEATSYE